MASCPVHLISAASLEGLWLLRCYREVRVWVLYHMLDPGIEQEVGDAGWVDTAAHGVTTCGSRILKVLLRHLEGSCSSGNRASAHPPGWLWVLAPLPGALWWVCRGYWGLWSTPACSTQLTAPTQGGCAQILRHRWLWTVANVESNILR